MLRCAARVATLDIINLPVQLAANANCVVPELKTDGMQNNVPAVCCCSGRVQALVSLPPWPLVVYRGLVQLAACLPLLLGARASPLPPPGTRWQLYLAALLTALLPLALYLALTAQPAWLLAASLATTPLLASLLGRATTGEHCALYRLLTVGLLVAGVVLFTCQPSPPRPALHLALARANLLGLPASWDGEVGVAGWRTGAGLAALVAAPLLSSSLVVLGRHTRHTHCAVQLLWRGLAILLIGCMGLFSLGLQPDPAAEVSRAAREVGPADLAPAGSNQTTGPGYSAPLPLSARMFSGYTEWLLATLIAFLGVTVSLLVTKVSQPT